MYKYKIDFSKYKLRDYERELAIKEFENQFPLIKDKAVSNTGIEFTTTDLLDETILRKLTFYSESHYQNEQSIKSNILTDQSILENYENSELTLFHRNKVGCLRPSTTREIRYLSHSFHEYKGRFYPQLAKSFMNFASVKKGETVLDPFCGSGTTLVESFLYGVNAVGIDINPVAYFLTKAKVKSLLLKPKELKIIREIFKKLKDAKDNWQNIKIDNLSCLDIEYLKKWFPENNLKKIFFIQNIINKLDNEISQLFVKVILSNQLREYSYQDPSQLRIRRRKDNPPENLFESFFLNLDRQVDNLEKFQALNHFKLDSKIDNYLSDIRNLIESVNLKPNSIDLIITSPPYATALPYVDTDRLSLFVFGFTNKTNFRKLEESLIGNREITKAERKQLDKELEANFKISTLPEQIISLLKKIYILNKETNVGFRRKNTAALLYKYFLDMDQGINQLSKVLKKNKYAFIVIGNNRTTAGNENIDIPTDDFIAYLAEKNNLTLIEKINMTVQKSYLIHSKNSINTESILVLKRK